MLLKRKFLQMWKRYVDPLMENNVTSIKEAIERHMLLFDFFACFLD